MKQQLLFQTDYSAWASQRVLSACAVLTPDEAARDLGDSHASIQRTLHHYYISEEFWVQCLHANAMPRLADIGDPPPSEDDPPLPSVADMEHGWPGIRRSLRAYIENANEDELAGDLVGLDRRIARWKLLLHMVNHSTLHRGQITGMLRRLGKKPPNTDLITYALQHP